MNCPYCHTPNDPANRFCVSCGRDIHAQPIREGGMFPIGILGIQTARLLLALLGLSILNTIFTSLAFIKELRIPDFVLTTPNIITFLIYTVAVILLVNYVRMLGFLWPQAFPKYQEVMLLVSSVIYLIIFTMAYQGLKPPILAYSTDTIPLTLLQVILLFTSLVMLGRASVIVYNALPSWLSNIRWQMPVYKEKENE